jgi:ribosome-associated heat shock protein Hsp15
MRIDKWLWAARFFKTRALAAKACELGRIRSNEIAAKPAREVRVGDRLEIKNEGGEYEVAVVALSEMRGPAAVAVTLYRETDESRERRLAMAELKKAAQPFDAWLDGKPNKRDRREIDRFRGR